jgi:hypothetical protein
MGTALTLTGVFVGLLTIAVPAVQFTVDTLFRLVGL